MAHRRLEALMTAGFARLAAVSALVVFSAGASAAQVPRLRVGGDIQRPAKVVHVDPIYPEKAKADKISGMVILEIVIGTEGTVMETVVIRSAHPLLDAAATKAVAQWEFTPTLLNGRPVELIMSVNVTFAAGE
jgi:TonB family protein